MNEEPENIWDMENGRTYVNPMPKGSSFIPPNGCICGSFWTVRQAHKISCPLSTGGVRVVGESAANRIMKSLDNRRTGALKPNRLQVAMVLHALADHTAIMSALEHRPDPTSPWPKATSIGRWFHDVGDDLEVSEDA